MHYHWLYLKYFPWNVGISFLDIVKDVLLDGLT